MQKIVLMAFVCIMAQVAHAQTIPNKRLFKFDKNSSPRWSSFENSKAQKGKGGMENNGAKGHPSDALTPGETKTLLQVSGSGIINRIWITINDRSPQMLRSLKLEMF